MTHFTVLVRYEGKLEDVLNQIETKLAPYDEQLETPRYKKYMDARGIESMAKHYNVDMTQPVMEALNQLVPHMQDWDGGEGGIDVVDGAPKLFRWSTYNPQSKWDWFELGGRWQGMLRLHVGKQGIQGGVGTFGRMDNKKPQNADAAYLNDVDFEGMEREGKAQATEDYYKAVEAIEKAMKKGGNELDNVWSSNYYTLGVEDESLEEHIARQGGFSTHAVLDANGWQEWSKMGWFGSHYQETETEAQWSSRFKERFLSNPTDETVIAIVDCHI